ncbi:MAG: Gfo/Idh/MocA family oxidoreductase [Candidatus Afipia apatlaquensis]|uniref:Gfo/Idh/MocA family oxidoreductase n=1 Tax=Candidatus Afipia apatlaquensis TaxID=2712852 RepID=A0A7C9VJX4_9BRAD|nr:Gfo/Idh/MocA family oxidoreductase [Candidatus Afipia apatlaquensis]
MDKVSLALIGAGSRSRAYTSQLVGNDNAELVSVVEPDKDRRELIRTTFNIKPDMAFSNEDDFFNSTKCADAVLICTMDREHHRQAIKAIKKGYDVLLEKPVSLKASDCIDILDCANKYDAKVMVCHVLRYAPFFQKIKQILNEGKLGKVISIQHNENINIFHYSHSYVRGNWRKTSEASPIILAKSCHDFDIINWLVNDKCKSVSSFGGLSYFKRENAPANSTGRCFNCPERNSCIFNAEKIYLEGYWWNKGAVNLTDQSDAGIRSALKEGPYGRCVFKCDNDVCDHQVSILEFENGVTASFSMSAFTNPCSRTIKVMCEKGEIRGNMAEIEIQLFGSEPEKIKMAEIVDDIEKHGGGDYYLLNDFIGWLQDKDAFARTTLSQSIDSHLMAFAAEKSRIEHRVISMQDLL